MHYGNYTGNYASKEKSGIARDKTNPAQLGYSVNIPLNRVRKQDLTDSTNINLLNRPDANLTTTPANSLGTLSTFTDQTSQFAKDLYNESMSFLTTTTFDSVPNYWLVGGALALLLAFKGGQHKGRHRR